MKIKTQISLLTVGCVTFLGVAIGLVWLRADQRIREMQDQLVTNQAVRIGKTIAQQVAATRATYSRDIVAQLKPQGVTFSQTPADGEAPLPAVFIGHVSARMKEEAGEDAASFVLRSAWNVNPEQGLDTDFETNGWQHLLQQDQAGKKKSAEFDPFWQRGILADGSEVIRVMTPDLASSQSCVDCHNRLEQSPEIRTQRGATPLKQFALGDLMGAVVTSVPIAESQAIVSELADTQAAVSLQIWAVVGIGLASAVFASLFIGRRIGGPISRATAYAKSIAGGNLDDRYEIVAHGEVGELAAAMDEMRDNLAVLVEQLTDNSEVLGSAAGQLTESSVSLADDAYQATEQSSAVAAAAEEMSVNMNNMAQSTEDVSGTVKQLAQSIEEMKSTIVEMAANASKSADVADQAASLVEVSSTKIGDLGTAANEIGKVIEVIQDIAEQTNLLALNATIEAARAGEAGKGFAVVATEVKELAKQTAAATEDIRKRIEGIQGSTGEAVRAIEKISDVIHNVNEVSSTMAAAVEEQSVTTRQIAENVAHTALAAESVATGVRECAGASGEITQNIARVDNVLRDTADGVRQSKAAGDKFNELASRIRSLIGRFKRARTDSSISKQLEEHLAS